MTNGISLPGDPASLLEVLAEWPVDTLPGRRELLQMCSTARQVNAICELLGLEARDYLVDDPEDPPYLWEEDDA